MPGSITDRVPGLVARMGQLSLDSTLRECLAIRKEAAAFRIALDEAAAEGQVLSPLVLKIMATPEYRNYREVTKQLYIYKTR